jgi:hypothetical protein
MSWPGCTRTSVGGRMLVSEPGTNVHAAQAPAASRLAMPYAVDATSPFSASIMVLCAAGSSMMIVLLMSKWMTSVGRPPSAPCLHVLAAPRPVPPPLPLPLRRRLWGAKPSTDEGWPAPPCVPASPVASAGVAAATGAAACATAAPDPTSAVGETTAGGCAIITVAATAGAQGKAAISSASATRTSATITASQRRARPLHAWHVVLVVCRWLEEPHNSSSARATSAQALAQQPSQPRRCYACQVP